MKKFLLSIGCLLLCAGLFLPLLISCGTNGGKDAQTTAATADGTTAADHPETTNPQKTNDTPEPKVVSIYTAEQLLLLAQMINEEGTGEMTKNTVYRLVTDLDLNEGWDGSVQADGETVTQMPSAPAVVWPGIVKFCGTLDGNGNKITGVYMSENPGSNDTVGFIRELSGGTIKDLTIENSFITASVEENAQNVAVGGLVGKIGEASVIQNVTVDADLYLRADESVAMSGKVGACAEGTLDETAFLFTGNLYRANLFEPVTAFSENDSVGTVYTISSADELYAFADKIGASAGKGSGYVFKLTADIDLNPGWNAKPTINTGTKEITFPEAPANSWKSFNFAGTFDGQGHSISGLYRDTEIGEWGDIGLLFKWLTDNATVRNLLLVNGFFYGHQPKNATSNRIIGGLASYANGNNITVENVYIDVNIWDSGYNAVRLGGVIGRINNDKTGLRISNVVFAGTIGSISTRDATTYPSTATGTQAGQLIGDANVRPFTCTNTVLAGSIYTADKTWDNIAKNNGNTSKVMENIVIGKFASAEEANAAGKITGYNAETVDMTYSEEASMILPTSVAEFFAQ